MTELQDMEQEIVALQAALQAWAGGDAADWARWLAKLRP